MRRFVQEYEYIIAEDLVDTYRKIMSGVVNLLMDYGYSQIVAEEKKGKLYFMDKKGGSETYSSKPRNAELEKAQDDWFMAYWTYFQKLDVTQGAKMAEKSCRNVG